MAKGDVGKRLKDALEAKSMKNVELARKLRLTPSALTNYYAGRSEVPIEVLKEAAKVLGVSVAYLVTGEADERPAEIIQGEAARSALKTPYEVGATVALPVWLGVLAADDDEECFYEQDHGLLEEVPIFLLGPHKPDECFLIRAAGSSASPRIEHSEMAVCKRSSSPPLNTLVVATRPDGASFVKALRAGQPPIPFKLEPLNEHFSSITEVKGWTFSGSVIAIMKSPEPGRPNIEWNFGIPLRA